MAISGASGRLRTGTAWGDGTIRVLRAERRRATMASETPEDISAGRGIPEPAVQHPRAANPLGEARHRRRRPEPHAEPVARPGFSGDFPISGKAHCPPHRALRPEAEVALSAISFLFLGATERPRGNRRN